MAHYVSNQRKSNQRNLLILTVTHAHARQWHFRCATEAEREKWVHAFLAATLIAHGDQAYNYKKNSGSRDSREGGRYRKGREKYDADSDDENENEYDAINR